MDALLLHALAREMRESLIPSAVRKIYEMDEGLFLFNFWKDRELWLLLSLREKRVHLVPQKWAPSPPPSSFCMFLRKHVEGLFLEEIEQPPFERVIILHVMRKTPSVHLKLVVELLERKGNVLLLNEEGKILRSFQPPAPEQKSPGGHYLLPAKPVRKRDPREAAAFLPFKTLLQGEGPGDESVDRALARLFLGLNSTYAREITSVAGLEDNAAILSLSDEEWQSLHISWDKFWKRALEGPYSPVLFFEEECTTPIAWGFWPYMEYAAHRMERLSSLNEVMSSMTGEEEIEKKEEKKTLIGRIGERHKKLEKRLLSMHQDMNKLQEALNFKEPGELLLLNLKSLRKGMTSIEVENIYAPDSGSMTIALDEKLSPYENASRYFERFKKAKRGIRTVTARLQETEQELERLAHLLQLTRDAQSDEEMVEIAEALAMPNKMLPGLKGEAAAQGSAGHRRFLYHNFEILAGKNPAGNDEISTKIAQPDDLWFHTHQIPSAHVILRMKGNKTAPPQEVLLRAAAVAAYYSKARNSSKVPVDYTRARFVRKTKHMQPGMVTIIKERNILVNPLDEAFLEWMRGYEKSS
jgi:predicted ribosome quality control (RQC) complex YloA/Tae2 family protein